MELGKKSFNSSLSSRAGHSEAKAASSLAGGWLCVLAAGLRVPTCRPGRGPVGPGGRGFSLTSCECGLRFCLSALVLQPSVCVCFSGMEDSYTVTCGLPLPCLAADAQRNGSGSHCAGEWKTRQIGILSFRCCLTIRQTMGGGLDRHTPPS